MNEAELANIADAVRWVRRRKRKALDQGFLNELHKHMYGDVWKWAGTYRTVACNIGIDTYRIPAEYHQVIDDAKYWAENSTFPPDEIAAVSATGLLRSIPIQTGMAASRA